MYVSLNSTHSQTEKAEGRRAEVQGEMCLHATYLRVEYLGHLISADDVRPTEETIRAIAKARAPRNVAQLRSLLGLVNYGKLFPQLSTT